MCAYIHYLYIIIIIMQILARKIPQFGMSLGKYANHVHNQSNCSNNDNDNRNSNSNHDNDNNDFIIFN